LQRLADEFGLTIAVTPSPTGASKWNPIDHRMFSLISGTWAGEPLVSYAVMLNSIRSTRSSQGFHCRAHLDPAQYRTGYRVTPEERKQVRVQRRRVNPKWNYVIRPHDRPEN
jgi:Rhodopirellula transposase DDE domain